MTLTTRLSIVAGFSVLVMAGVTWRTPQSLYSDPAFQIDALQEFVLGHSRSFNETVKPKASDLSENESSWIIWWPPGTQIVAYPFLSHGLPIGSCLRLISITLLFFGAVGWARWMRCFDIPERWLLVTAALLPWMRYSSTSLFQYSAEILAFGTSPWLLLAMLSFTRAYRGQRWPFWGLALAGTVLGLGLGFRYVLKYSGVFLSIGALLFLVESTRPLWRKGSSRIPVLLTVLGWALPVTLLNLLNHHFGHAANGVVSTVSISIRWQELAAAIANPALAMVDADAVIRYLFLNPAHSMGGDNLLISAGIPGGLVILWLLWSSRSQRPAERLAGRALVVSQLLLACVWIVSNMADLSARHMASASIMMLPFCLQEGIRRWRSGSSTVVKAVLALTGTCYIAIPLLYGPVSVITKIQRIPRDYAVEDHRLFNPHLANRDLKGVRERLLADFDPDHDIFYLPDPVTGILLPGRTIVRQADFMTLEQLQRERYTTSKPLRIRALIPPIFERNGKAKAIRASFPQAQFWRAQEIPGCNYVLWTAVLNATADHR